MSVRNYDFSTDWFSGHIPNWTKLFDKHVGVSPRILEIGSFEGRSTVWLIERLSREHGGGEIYCIDPWIGADFRTETFDMTAAEMRFRRNTEIARARFPGVTLHQMKETSVDACSLLLLEARETFDFIYVDGDHTSKAALTDLILCHNLCKKGGIIAVDDYLWDYEGSILSGPKPGVDAYTTIFHDEVEQLRHFPVYQVFLRKRP
jgi:predicted O-methyltransferase YrrM